eukprot:15468854-Alexandrium_andersonii.AAC.1
MTLCDCCKSHEAFVVCDRWNSTAFKAMSISGSLALYMKSSDFGKGKPARWFTIASRQRQGKGTKEGVRERT